MCYVSEKVLTSSLTLQKAPRLQALFISDPGLIFCGWPPLTKLFWFFKLLSDNGWICIFLNATKGKSPLCPFRRIASGTFKYLSYISAPRPQMSQPSPQPLHILRAVSRTSLPPTRPARYSACVRRSCTAPATGWSSRPRRAWPAGRPAVNSAKGGGTVGTVHKLCLLCYCREPWPSLTRLKLQGVQKKCDLCL